LKDVANINRSINHRKDSLVYSAMSTGTAILSNTNNHGLTKTYDFAVPDSNMYNVGVTWGVVTPAIAPNNNADPIADIIAGVKKLRANGYTGAATVHMSTNTWLLFINNTKVQNIFSENSLPLKPSSASKPEEVWGMLQAHTWGLNDISLEVVEKSLFFDAYGITNDNGAIFEDGIVSITTAQNVFTMTPLVSDWAAMSEYGFDMYDKGQINTTADGLFTTLTKADNLIATLLTRGESYFALGFTNPNNNFILNTIF